MTNFERFVANFKDMTEDDFVEFMLSCAGYCNEMLCSEVKDFRRETQCTHCFYKWAKKEEVNVNASEESE